VARGPDSVGADTDPAREAVRRAVEQARAELAAGALHAEEAVEEPEELEARAASNADAETASQESVWAGREADAETASEKGAEAAREAVRRAVERARAEMAAGALQPRDILERDEVRSEEPSAVDGEEAQESPAAAHSMEAFRQGSRFVLPAAEEAHVAPLAMVIEDPEGRVELARVFDVLNRLDCSQASLLNYTTHSVTVSLSPGATLPTSESIADAVEAAFGRACHVAEEGVRISVRMGERRKKGVA